MLEALKMTALALTVAIAVGGCTTSAQRKAIEHAVVKKEVAQEVERICALPSPEREAELKKLKEESGFELYCAKR